MKSPVSPKLVKKVKQQNPTKTIDKLTGVLPDRGTGVDYITGTTYPKPKTRKKSK
jgi:hypothetical protein